MLQTGTVEKRTYTLLKRIMEDPVFKDYFLVGGTASALQMGHRKSIDLDLFTRNDIDVDELQNHLKKSYEFQDDFRARNTLKGKINGVSIDCIKYDYPLLKPLVCESNIRILSLEDISAMKLSSVTDNGSRIKDFVDLAYMSAHLSLNEMLSCYKKKFGDVNVLSPAKALVYYNDIDFENEPVNLIDGNFSWNVIKDRLEDMVLNSDKVYKEYPSGLTPFDKQLSSALDEACGDTRRNEKIKRNLINHDGIDVLS